MQTSCRSPRPGAGPGALALALLAACAEAPPKQTVDQRTAALQGTIALQASAAASARPLPAVRLQLRLASGAVQEAASDEQGRFEMTLLEPGAARLSWCGGGADPGSWAEPLALKPGARVLVQIAAKAARSGSPSCEQYFAPEPGGRAPPRSFEVAAPAQPPPAAKERAPRQPVLAVKGAPPLKETRAALRGSVADARGAPIAAARVQLRRAGEELLLREAVSGADGRFELAGLAPHRYDVEVAAAEGETVVAGLWLGPGAARDLTLRFGARRGSVRVRGRVLGPDGAPARARVGARSHTASAAIVQPSLSDPEVVHTGADGSFSLSVADQGDLNYGGFDFFAASEDGALLASLSDWTPSGDDRVADLQLRPAGNIVCAGRVLLPDGRPAAAATVRASDARWAPARYLALSAEDGSFQLRCLGASAVLRAQLGPATAMVEVAVPASGVELRLLSAATLRLKVAARAPVHRLVARVLPLDDLQVPEWMEPDERVMQRRAESEGEPFEVEGLPIGRPIDVSVVADDGRAAAASVVLPGPGTWEAELPLD